MTESERSARAKAILAEIKPLAIEYEHLTGKPLGVTGEIGEMEASVALGMTLEPARSPGVDALRGKERVQIKATRVPPGKKRLIRENVAHLNQQALRDVHARGARPQLQPPRGLGSTVRQGRRGIGSTRLQGEGARSNGSVQVQETRSAHLATRSGRRAHLAARQPVVITALSTG
jgi:hypothetical protein